MANTEQTRTKQLQTKQQRLQALIPMLQVELREITAELQGANPAAKPRLTQQFFHDVVVPLLEDAGHNGLTARELFHQVKGAGVQVGYGNLRLFLTRAGKKGTIRKIPMVKSVCRWGLPRRPLAVAASTTTPTERGAMT